MLNNLEEKRLNFRPIKRRLFDSYYGVTTCSVKTHCIKTLGIKTLGIKTLGIKTLSINGTT